MAKFTKCDVCGYVSGTDHPDGISLWRGFSAIGELGLKDVCSSCQDVWMGCRMIKGIASDYFKEQSELVLKYIKLIEKTVCEQLLKEAIGNKVKK